MVLCRWLFQKIQQFMCGWQVTDVNYVMMVLQVILRLVLRVRILVHGRDE